MPINLQNLTKWFKSLQNYRKRFFLFTASTLLILFLVGYSIFKKFPKQAKITNIENLSIEAINDIYLKDIQVKWYRANSNGILSDSLTFINKKNCIVPHANGENCFVIFHKNKPVKVFGHYVYSGVGGNKYLLKIWIQDNIADCSLKIDGPDSYTAKTWSEMLNLSYLNWEPNTTKPTLLFNCDFSKVENIINFTLSPADFGRIVTPEVDTCIEKLPALVNSSTCHVLKLKTRGKGSLNYQRKCYNVTMKEQVSFKGTDTKDINLKTFSLISLSMDNYYFRNRIALDLLKQLHIINTYYSFVEVRINEKSQGVYLLIENPKKHLTDSLKSPFILRRGYENSNFYTRNLMGKLKSYVKQITGTEKYDYDASRKLKKDEERQYLKQYKSIYTLIKKEKGHQLYESLKNVLDIKGYMRLMAFNYIICNHDYTDEQFFFINGLNNDNIFHTFPWDFDDVFSNSPHEGWILRNKLLKEKLIFSGEDFLDLAIANDEILYGIYLNELDNVIKELSETNLQELYQNIYSDLFAFYNNKEIIEQSKYDQFETEYNTKDFQKQLNANFLFLSQRFKTIKTQLELGQKIVITKKAVQ